MKKGFTLIELLAVIILLGLIFVLTFPKVLEIVENKEIEIDNVTKKLIINGVDQYMKNNVDIYPKEIGNNYCFLIDDIDKENLIAISVDDYLDKYVTVKIGKSNSYKIVEKCDSDTCDIQKSGYTGSYDGDPHGITVSLIGATIKYGEAEGTYDLDESPTITNVGEKTVYYKVTKAGCKTVEGSEKITINKAKGKATLSSTSGTVKKNKTISFTVSGATGAITCASSNTSVATCSVSGTTVIVTGVGAGNANISVNIAESENYTATNRNYTVSVPISLNNVVKIGDYVKMTPTSNSYEISVSTGCTSTSVCNGVTTQTINPSELNLWRVININSDGTIDMVSEYVSSTEVYFYGLTGYNNFHTIMSPLANQYQNKSYTTSARMIGTGSDYNVDINLIKTVVGKEQAYAVGTQNIKSYWLYTIGSNSSTSKYCYYSGGTYYTTYYVTLYDGTKAYSARYAIRPIVTLKSEVSATGNGTSSSPWVLK